MKNQSFDNAINMSRVVPLLQDNLNRMPRRSALSHLTPNIASEGPCVLRGTGANFYAQVELKILDFASSTVNCSLGQNDPWVKANLLAYLHSEMPSFLSTRLKSPIFSNYPERLVRAGIGGIKNPRINHRQCNGSDVTELALLAASTRAGKRSKVVSFFGGYHGQNLTSYIVSEKQKHLRFLCGDVQAVFLPTPCHQPEDEKWELRERDRQILCYLENMMEDVFAVILEPIQMNNGVLCLSPLFLEELRVLCSKHDVCLIYDEIQTGFGWLGSLTAAESYGIPPDILCLSKGVTAGYGPMALMVAEEKYSDLPYGSGEKTNGADIRALVAANAVLDRLVGVEDSSVLPHVDATLANELRTGLLPGVPEKSAMLRELLSRMKAEHPVIVEDTRQQGLISGVLVKTNDIKSIVGKALSRGLFLRNTGNWLIIKPPLIITRGEMEEGFAILGQILAEATRG